MLAAEWIVRAVLIYTTVGVVFAVAFALRGVQRVDPSARGAHPLFRLLIVPGVAALWPFVLRRWMAAARRPVGSERHS